MYMYVHASRAGEAQLSLDTSGGAPRKKKKGWEPLFHMIFIMTNLFLTVFFLFFLLSLPYTQVTR